MTTIESRSAVEKMLKNKGECYKGDPKATAIYLYKNIFNGGAAYKIIWETHMDNFLEVGNYRDTPAALMQAGEVTAAGKQWLEHQEWERKNQGKINGN